MTEKDPKCLEDRFGLTEEQYSELTGKFTLSVLEAMVRRMSSQSIRERHMTKYRNNYSGIVTMTVDLGINKPVTHQLSFDEASLLASMGRLLEYQLKNCGRGIKKSGGD